jgi:hypothetical protein
VITFNKLFINVGKKNVAQEIESSAGRLGIEEEAMLSKQRNRRMPKDFPLSDSSFKVEVVDKKMKIEDDVDSSFFKPSLVDENEIEEILQKVNANHHSSSQKQNRRPGAAEGGSIDCSTPICEVEFDLDFH